MRRSRTIDVGRRRRVAALAAAAVLVIASVSVIVAVMAARGVGTVDGIPIEAAELAFQEDRAAHEGASGDAAIRARALSAIADDHALVAVARDAGVTSMTTPAEILKARDQTNADREALVAAGQVVYGKTNYTAEEFYSRTLAELRSAVARALTTGTSPLLTVSDGEVVAYLTEHLADWSANATTFDVTLLTTPADDRGGIASALQSIATTATLEQLAAATPGARIDAATYDPAAFDASGFSPDVKRQLQDARVGDVVGPFPLRGGWAMLRLDSRSVSTAAALALHGDEVRSKLLGEKVDDLIAKRRQAQKNEFH